ncbi:MAG TPA: hypothetical protein VM938_07350 [Acidimicrobiales bacterium]|nr:hypothetical protein [Acidimicrobiales bacterium]
MTTVAAYVPDLMDRSKVAAAGKVTFARTPADLVEVDADIVVVDLSRAGVLDVLPSLAGRRVIGFGSHVDTALLDAARAAGVTEVLPRSKFFSRLAELLGGA